MKGSDWLHSQSSKCLFCGRDCWLVTNSVLLFFYSINNRCIAGLIAIQLGYTSQPPFHLGMVLFLSPSIPYKWKRYMPLSGLGLKMFHVLFLFTRWQAIFCNADARVTVPEWQQSHKMEGNCTLNGDDGELSYSMNVDHTKQTCYMSNK